jgi:hypothetical protein
MRRGMPPFYNYTMQRRMTGIRVRDLPITLDKLVRSGARSERQSQVSRRDPGNNWRAEARRAVPQRAAREDSTWYTFQAGGIYQPAVLPIAEAADGEESLTAARREDRDSDGVSP